MSAKDLGLPSAQGLYDPRHEHESCGVGFVCDIKGRPSRRILEDARHINCCMVHRGGLGYEANTGDGAGILTGSAAQASCELRQGVLWSDPACARGIWRRQCVSAPPIRDERAQCIDFIEKVIADEGQECLGWRDLPHDEVRADLGSAAIASMPYLSQVFIKAGPGFSGDKFERALYIIRKFASRVLRIDEALSERKLMYFCSLSSRVLIYKGMLTPHQLFDFYDDLCDEAFESHLAMVHSRFSTNTFPSWDRAQPNRFMSHNGEIQHPSWQQQLDECTPRSDALRTLR